MVVPCQCINAVESGHIVGSLYLWPLLLTVAPFTNMVYNFNPSMDK